MCMNPTTSLDPGFEMRTDGRGMHIEGTWYQLTNGMWYMDQVTVFPELGVALIVVCVAVVCA